MAFIPTPATAKVVVGQTLHGVSISNTLWFTKGSTFTAAQLATLANAVLVAWTDYVLPNQSSELTLIQVQAYDMTAIDGPVYTDTAPGSETGGNTGTPALPGNVALAITFRTDARGKSGRGRIYYAGLTEGQVTGNTVAGATLDEILADFGDAMAAVEAATGADHVIVSFFEEGEPRPAGLPRPVVAYTSEGRVDTQRRRLG